MEFSDDFLNILYLLKLEKLLRRRIEIKAELKDEIERLLRRRNEIKSELIDEIELLDGEEYLFTEFQYEDDDNNSKNGSTNSKIGSIISKNESTIKNPKKRKIKRVFKKSERERVYKKSDLMPKQNFIKRYDPNDFKPFIRNRKNEQCDLCGKILRRSNLEFHMNSHYNKKPFVCDFENCNLAFSAPSTLFRHKKLHTANKQFSCDICSAKFHFNGNLQKHKIIHNEPKFKCLRCGNMFKSSTRLKYHITIMHGEFQNIDCTVSSCDKKFANSLVLRKHLRIFHDIKVRFRVRRPEIQN